MTHRKNASLRAIAAAEYAPSQKLAAANMSDTVVEISPNDIDHNAGLKDRFSPLPEGFDALKASIEEHGQQQPILVGRLDPHTGKYPIIAGRTRHRIASLLEIPLKAIVRPIEGDARLAAQLQENLARTDYTIGDKIGIMIELKKLSYKQVRIAEMMNLSTTDISKLLGIYGKLKDLAKTEEFPRALLSSRAGRPKWERLVKALQELPHNSQSKVCGRVIDQIYRSSNDPILLAMIAIREAVDDPLSVTAYRPPEKSYEKARTALASATFNTRDLCRLKYEGDSYVNALLQKAIQIEHATLKAMIMKRFDVLVAEAMSSDQTGDRSAL